MSVRRRYKRERDQQRLQELYARIEAEPLPAFTDYLVEMGPARIERQVVASEPLNLLELPYAELRAIMGTSLADAVLGWKREDAENPVVPLRGYTITRKESR